MNHTYYAHTHGGSERRWEPLPEHLQLVSSLAREYAAPLGCAAEAELAGLLHDLGKYSDAFQKRLRGEASGVDHWSPGAVVALSRYQAQGIAAALSVAGHHTGLDQAHRTSLGELVRRCPSEGINEYLQRFAADGLELPEPPESTVYSGLCPATAASAMLDVRMLYSVLVDADYVATEAHFQGGPGGKILREPGPALRPEDALQGLLAHLRTLAEGADTSSAVHELKQALLAACLEAADSAQGLFTLTGPTGSGKTLAALAFALAHAVRHGLRRVVVVLPYLSIIEQTVAAFRRALDAVLGERADEYVLEDHSMAHPDTDGSEAGYHARLLAQNWDAPIVVTTTVQCLESLFASRPGRCRKLHRLARSVLVFDEAQTLPKGLAVPTLATLSHLSARFGTTVVLATATQPAFAHLDGATRTLCASGWQPTEIAQESQRLFRLARRTRVDWSLADDPQDWNDIAEWIAEAPQSLCIVNLKRHAVDLTRLLQAWGVDGLSHLSTNMCPAHRAVALTEVRRRLDAGEPCRLVATQCVEAGVDVDFPLVLRAMAPLDSIAQAAGRCNRRGLQSVGMVRVFTPKTEGRMYPDRSYGQAADLTRELMAEFGPEGVDIDDPGAFTRYYTRLYDLAETGRTDHPIIKAICVQHFEEVASAYRVIDRAAINVLVPYDMEAYRRLDDEAHAVGLTGQWVRQARPHAIGMYPTADVTHLAPVFLPDRRETAKDWFVYCVPGHYDDLLGLAPDGSDDCFIA
jgi:CRISPR-associated endonuclease/helicase Cas3